MTMKLKKNLLVVSEKYQKGRNPHYSKCHQAGMHKWNEVVMLLNDTDVVVVVLYFIEKFVREGYKNFGLDMT